ncbi:hypothetical protein [Brevibacterium oceani]|uniref:hypothetical protein n=1 Tax=Brevibacterium oceani TaxID=358099 RepID=UPI0015E736B4|nr:hypothetical protein [Brevibacterium oceani]
MVSPDFGSAPPQYISGGAERLISGLSLISAPLLWTAGLFLQWLARARAGLTLSELGDLDAATFAAPMLLEIHARQPGLSTAGSTLLLLGILLLVPAAFALSRQAAAQAPWSATLGCVLLTVGLMARMFYLGVDATAFNVVERLGAEAASSLILDGYGELAYAFWRVPVIASAGTILGSLLLAFALFRSERWGLLRCLFILPAGWLGMGVLKEHEPGFGGLALTVALLPCGFTLLRGHVPRPRCLLPKGLGRWRNLVSW